MIVRSKRNTNFTVINNQVINDPKIGWAELGLLVYLLSKPDNWQVSATHLAKQRKAGRDAVYAMLKRLRDAGYAKYKRNSDGTTDWLILDAPHPENPDEASEAQEPHPEKPDLEKPDLDNPTLVKTENSVKTENPTNTSVPDGTGQGPSEQETLFPKDPTPKAPRKAYNGTRHRIWKLGVDLLTSQGMKETGARSFLGKLAKSDEGRLAEVIGYCAANPKLDAAAYIRRAMSGDGRITNNEQAIEIGKSYGLEPNPGETTEHFIKRVEIARRTA